MEDRWRKPMTLQEARGAVRKTGKKVKNPWKPYPISEKTFPDGADWRVEISGIESVKILKATIDEAKKQGVPFHRAISVVKGATLYTKDELKEFAKVAEDEQVEVIITPGPRPSWDTGRQIATPEGAVCGFNMRGNESIAHIVKDISECIEVGFKGFLVWDRSVLETLDELRKTGYFPPDIIFKISIYKGIASSGDAKDMELLGAGSFNPKADLAPEMFYEMREPTSIPMDIHTVLWKSMGGYIRIYETPEFARVLSPCYFKMEPGPGFDMYTSWGMSEDQLAGLGRRKIRTIKRIYELIGETYPEFKVSEQGPKDLRIPRPRG